MKIEISCHIKNNLYYEGNDVLSYIKLISVKNVSNKYIEIFSTVE